MGKKSTLSLHQVCLISLFLLENIIIKFSGSGISLIQLASLLIATLLIMPVLLKLCNSIYCIESIRVPHGIVTKSAYTVIYLFTELYALFIAYNCVFEFTDFTSTVILPNASGIWVSFLFLSVCVWLSIKNPLVILKFSIVLSIIVFLSVALLFFFSIPYFNTDIESLFSNFDLKLIFNFNNLQTNSVIRMFCSLPLIFVFSALTFGKENKKSVFPGILLGAMLFGICIFQMMMLFEEKYLATLSFPYLSSISILAADDVYLRMDGLVYIIFYTCSLIKTAVCFLTIQLLYEKFSKKASGFIPLLCGMFIVLLSLLK